MNEALKRIGRELQRRYAYMLTMPMNWRMIDAFVRLEEVDERQRLTPGSPDPASDRKSEVDQNVVFFPKHDDGKT